MPVKQRSLMRCQEHDPSRGPFEVTTPSFVKTDTKGNVGQLVMRVGKTARRGRYTTAPSQERSRSSRVQLAVKKLTARRERHADLVRRYPQSARAYCQPGSLNPHKG